MPSLDTENSVEMIKEVSSATGDSGSIAMKVFIIGVMLVAMGVGAKRWFYPFALEDVQREIRATFKLLRDNTTLEFDLLGDSAGQFRRRLDKEQERMLEIEERSMVEPNRWNILGWFTFRWQEMRDVKRCYLSLMVLKKEIKMEVETRRRHLFAPTA
ncbi:hypothetical protein PQX77_005345, partial [Marasmius sp. AFHP31]